MLIDEFVDEHSKLHLKYKGPSLKKITKKSFDINFRVMHVFVSLFQFCTGQFQKENIWNVFYRNDPNYDVI